MNEQLERDLERYLKSYSQDPTSRVFAPLGETYRKLGKLDEAIGILEEGIKSHQNYASGYLSLGHCFSDKGETKRAIGEFQKALKFSPDNIMAYKLLAAEYKKLKDEKALVGTYKKLLELSPADGEAMNYLGGKGLLPKHEPKIPVQDSFVDVPLNAPAKPQVVEKTETGQSKALEFYTMTLAEIYMKQGLKKEAREIYEVLKRANPSNSIYADAISRLEEKKVILAAEVKEDKHQKEADIPQNKLSKLKNVLSMIGSRRKGL